jgi:TolB-like protein
MKIITLGIALAIVLGASGQSSFAQGGLDQRVSELSQQIANKMAAKQKTTVAVVEFTDLQGNVTDLGRFLAEELVTRLGDLEKFKVIERQLLTKIIAEQKLSLTGIVDPASAKQLGKILGVDAIVAGSVTNLAQSVRVNARLISTETGEVFATASADIFKDESVVGLISGGAASKEAASAARPSGTGDKKTLVQTVTVDDFIFELESCKKTNTKISCVFTIRNDSTIDRRLSLNRELYSNKTRIFDESGNEYVVAALGLGSESDESRVQNTLVSQTRTRGWLRFENLTSDPNKLTLSIAVYSWQHNKTLVATLRDIQVQK